MIFVSIIGSLFWSVSTSFQQRDGYSNELPKNTHLSQHLSLCLLSSHQKCPLISLSSYQLVHWSLSPSLLEDHPLILSLPGPPVHPCPSLSIYSCLFSISCKSLLVFLAYLGFLSVYLSVPLNFFQFLHQLHFLIFSAVLNCSLFAG